jgi:phosphonate transport system ATP-binding protein
LVEPTAGAIHFHNKDITKLGAGELRRFRRNIGMIFQEFNLVNRMSVMDNVLSGRLGYMGDLRSFFKQFPAADVEQALLLLERVGLIEHVNKRADQLSGGQRQRVGIARALMQAPDLLLLDEPTASLDPKISRDVMALIRDMAQDLGVPVLCNIHDVTLAEEFCNRVLALRAGNLVYDGDFTGMDAHQLQMIYQTEAA